ncbi:MAG: hypothetical protein U0572_11815 [Phycisphaerales bacterium]
MSGSRMSTRMLLMGGLGVVLAAIVLLIANQLDKGSTSGDGAKRRIEHPQDLVNPSPLSSRESEVGRRTEGQPLAELERGAWVEVADDAGNLSQRYGAERVEPLPDRRLRLDAPRAIFFRPDGRVVRLEATKGEARVPSRELESGRLTGDVRIELFRPIGGKPVDLAADRPVLVAHAADATFDNVLGEIRCVGPIALESDVGSFAGEGMSLLVDPGKDSGKDSGKGGAGGKREGTLERLVIDRCTKPIVLVRGPDGRARPMGAAATTPSSAPAPGGGAPRSNAAQAPAGGAADRREERFYRLRLDDNVRVVREKNGRTSRMSGDRLEAVFSLDGTKSMSGVVARPMSAPSPRMAIVSSAFASDAQDASGSDERITIEYDGQLVLEPTDERLASRDDVHVRMLANDGRTVTLDDDETKAHVLCARVEFNGGADLIEAFGWTDRPLTVASPRLKASGGRFFLRRGAGKGGFEGPGTVELASGGEAFAALAFDPSRALVTSDADDRLVVVALAAGPDAAPRSVSIGWREKLDLDFEPVLPGSDANGDLRSATFVGAVAVKGNEFSVDAESIAAHFVRGADGAAAPAARTRLERLVADGAADAPATAKRSDGTGGLSAKKFDLKLVTDRDGNAAPARLEALGSVTATRPQQTVYGDALIAIFVDPDRPAPVTQNAMLAQSDSLSTAAADIESAQLTGDVQAELLADNAPTTRVFADRIDGDGIGRTLTVAGKDTWVVRDTVLVDRLESIRFEEATRVATSAGRGRVRVFPEAIAIAPGRAPRPSVGDRVRLVAEWTDGFTFDEHAADGHGAIDLDGAVRVRNTPDRSSTDAVDAAHLRMELAGDARVSFGGANSNGASAASGVAPITGERAAVRRIDARGAAVIESRAWSSAERAGDPRLFRIAGDHLSYDTLTREGFVEGPGSLLAHIPEKHRDAPPPAKTGAGAGDVALTAGSPLSLGAEGTTRFTWKERLDMVRVGSASDGGDRFDITMKESVDLMHAGSRADDTLSLSAALLKASVVREPAGKGAKDEPAGVDLGGTARIEAIEARGASGVRVLVRTPDLDLECDELSYSVATQLATLGATDGRTVAVLRKSDGQPIKAERVEWNLANGEIRILRAIGGVGR